VKPSAPANDNLIDRTRDGSGVSGATCPSGCRLQRARSRRSHTQSPADIESSPPARAIPIKQPNADGSNPMPRGTKRQSPFRSRNERTPPALAMRFSLGGTNKPKEQ
jgi:hypothetical protein